MVRIRLRREGSRHQPTYRIVVADRESPRNGRFLEILGHYNPRTEPATVVVDEASLLQWMKQGAQPSESVVKVLKTFGAWERWERVQKGESVDTVLAERAEQPKVDPRTRRDGLKAGGVSKKSRAKQEAAAAASPSAAAPETPAV
jgi:small subunit ribosomal protein S16